MASSPPPTEPTHDERILIVVPTYNERDNIERLIEAIHGQVPAAHVLVVDDNSPDGTGELADALAARDERVHVLHRPGKLGLGTAYIAGFRYALDHGYDLVFEMDADFSHRPEHLPAFLEAIRDADLVLGCRYMPGGGTEDWGIGRRLLSRGGNLYARLWLGLPLRDLTGGFKCFRRKVLETIPLDRVQSEGYAFQIELTWRAVQAGFRVVEVPIQFPDRRVGASKMSRRIVAEAIARVPLLRLERWMDRTH